MVKEAALSGDLAACKLLLDRAIPPLKAEERAVPIALPDDGLLSQARAALAALSAGAIAPGQLASIMTALAGTARIYELTELEARVTALEAEHDRES